VIVYSYDLWLTCIGMFVSGGRISLWVAVQHFGPNDGARWMTARALSLFFSGLAGGLAYGAGMWGTVAGHLSVEQAMVASGGMMLAFPLASFILPLPAAPSQADVELVVFGNEPDVGMAITLRSGPVSIEIDYDVAPDRARDFYEEIRKLLLTRLRNGRFCWSICLDTADAALSAQRSQKFDFATNGPGSCWSGHCRSFLQPGKQLRTGRITIQQVVLAIGDLPTAIVLPRQVDA
jgi:hypothetical protein